MTEIVGATLFSGIGAPETAMPRWRWPWHAEIEKFPSSVLAQRHPDSVNLGDVTANEFTKRAAAIAKPNVIVFGSPCQSFSVAGKRLGMDDPRGNLALCALGIIAGLKPRWFIFENVPGLLSSSEGRDFGLFLRAVDELGYSLAWTVLDAQHFGVAQRRERVFAVGHIGDWRGPAAVLFEPEGLCGDHPPRRQAGKGITHDIAPSLTNSGRGVERSGDTRGQDPVVAVAKPLGSKKSGGWRNDLDCDTYVPAVSFALNAGAMGRQDHETEALIAHSLRAEGFDASEDGTGRGTPIIPIDMRQASRGDKFTNNRSAGSSGGAPGVGIGEAGDPAPTIASSHVPAVAFHENQRAESTLNDTAGSLKVGGGKPGQGYPAALTGSAVRRLTPRECERLQGYPDNYTAITYRGKPAADGPRYKALGNSMAVPVMRWILTRIERVSEVTHAD